MLTSPESPTFLLSKGRKAEAESSAEALWGANYSQELYGTTTVAKMEMDVEATPAAAAPAGVAACDAWMGH